MFSSTSIANVSVESTFKGSDHSQKIGYMRFKDKTLVLSSLTLLTLNCIYKLFVNLFCQE